MCGFAGFLSFQPAPDKREVLPILERMASTIASRGPDDAGYWQGAAGDGAIGLAHRRLSVLDLSPAGHQPMVCHTGRYVMVFNGEIYNHLELRQELDRRAAPAMASSPRHCEEAQLTRQSSDSAPMAPAVPMATASLDRHASLAMTGQSAGWTVGGIAWRGHSDTETLLAGFVAWGVRATLERCIGMFAFALWDRQEQTLTLARDRLGEKPLYYGWQGTGAHAAFLFGSELKALRAHPAFTAAIDRDALCLYMRHNNVGGAHSIYRGVHKLLPGTLLTVSRRAPEPVVQTYWSAAAIAEQGVARLFTGSPTEAVDELEVLLRDAVRRQMMADVPLGAFLSGGVDSSTVVALMQAQSSRPVRTFSIGFHEADYNEAEHAKAVARHLGTQHTELYVTPEQAMAVIPRLPQMYDEPFADSSQIPTFLVSQLARQQVTVSLSGDAGDELFAGYNRYPLTASLWRRLSVLPLALRQAGAWGITRLSPQAWNSLTARTPLARRWANVGDKLHKGAAVMATRSADGLYHALVSHWQRPEQIVLGGTEPLTPLTGLAPSLDGLNPVERMMALDLLTYLPDDILTKVDRAAMAVSLETRVPFLDHRVVEFSWKMPIDYLLRPEHGGYTTKWLLRQVLYRHVPKALIERPKMGFGVPIDSWLRGPLRDWAEDLLAEPRLRQEGYFNPAPIRQKWAEHLSGQRNWQHHLWDVLMFQAWLAEQR